MTAPGDITDLVPHSATMSLLDQVLDHDKDSLCAQVSITKDSLFAEPAGIPAWVGVEYMAQAIAAYSGMMARSAGQKVSVGFLVGTRKYTCNQPFFPLGSTLKVSVYEELLGDNGLGVFRCKITADNIEANASLSVFQPNSLDEFLDQQREELSE